MQHTCRVATALLASLIGIALVNTQSAKAQSAHVREANRPTPEAPKSPGQNAIRAPEPGLRFVSSEMSFSGKIVKHAPYSAEVITESVQTLANGTKLTRRTNGMVYRDREGRTRRELSGTIPGPFATSSDAQRLIFINDPVAGTSSTIIPDSNTTNTRALPAHDTNLPPETEAIGENSRIESLGKQLIDGFEVEGTRTTILIPAGQIGNDQPLEIVHEQWYSPELQTILLSKHSDPRWGETIYKQLKINRGDPDRSLFTLPSRPTPHRNRTRPRQ